MDSGINSTSNMRNTKSEMNKIIDLSINSKRKRRILSVEEKVKIILEIKKGKRKVALCKEWGIKSSTLSTIWANRNKYLEALEHLGKSGSKFKRLRRPDKFDVDEALYKWFKQQRNENIPVTGSILMNKAKHFAKLLGHGNFICNNGWIDRFKLRHDISFPKIKEKSEHQNQQISDWLKTVWPKFRCGYEDKDIFNADEIGLFYKATPLEGKLFKGEKCVDGKLAKERLTVFVCANADGSEKRKLAVIGNSPTNMKRLSVNYYTNSKSWITPEILRTELKLWNNRLKQQNRKILLLFDNDISHTSNLVLSNIKFVYLPANSSSVVQPMEQGITKHLKYYFRKLVLLEIIKTLENKSEFTYSFLYAMDHINQAWQRVSNIEICRAFQKSGFCKEIELELEEDYEPLSQFLLSIKDTHLLNSDVDSFVYFDDDLVTSECQTEQEIAQEVINKHDLGNHELGSEKMVVPTLEEARQAARIITKFYDSQEVDPMIVLQATNIENDLEKRFWSEREIKQEKS